MVTFYYEGLAVVVCVEFLMYEDRIEELLFNIGQSVCNVY